MRNSTITPVGALWRGALAGIAGSAAMNAWFAVAGRHMPPPREGAFTPPEAIQETELPTETIARRLVSGLALRGPLEPATKRKAGQLVHFAYGAGWGALYGLLAESAPAMRRPIGTAAYGKLVWATSEHVVLPAFRLGPWPTGVTLKGHAFWLATHLVYAAALGSSYSSLRPRSFASVALSVLAKRLGASRTPTMRERVGRVIGERVPA